MSEEEKPTEKLNLRPNMKIVGFNLLALVIYTTVCAIFGGAAIIFDAFILLIHVAACIIIAGFSGKRAWWLSMLLVLLIGISTCVGILAK